jgi:ketosteroid isomerase-like protein
LDVPDLPQDFDQIAIVVDWLDACRGRDLNALLDLYAQDAVLECQCDGLTVNEGRARLASHWGSRLDALAPNAFGLEEITPTSNGVLLDYVSHEGKPVRMSFSFAKNGKIMQSRCEPSRLAHKQQAPSDQDKAL